MGNRPSSGPAPLSGKARSDRRQERAARRAVRAHDHDRQQERLLVVDTASSPARVRNLDRVLNAWEASREHGRLDVGNCGLASVPARVLQRHALREATFRNNPSFACAAEDDGCLAARSAASLTVLDVSACFALSTADLERLTSGLTSLVDLRASSCGVLTALPRAASLCPLIRLSAHKCRLQDLPLGLFSGTLEVLVLHGNYLTELPSDIGRARHLRRLSLHSNRLDSLPEAVSLLGALQHLSVHENRLRTIPPLPARSEVSEFTFHANPMLESLEDVSHGTLQSIGLEALSFRECALRSFAGRALNDDDGDSALHRALLHLTLSDNRALATVDGIGARLVSLEAERCAIVAFPTGLPSTLRLLRLHANKIVRLESDTVRHLTNLRYLDCSANALADIPGVAALTGLAELILNSNPDLASLPSPRGLGSLGHLEAHGCALQTLPGDVGALTKLHSLDVSGNPIGALPASIASCRSLTLLNVSGCRLEELPSAIVNAKHIVSVIASGNERLSYINPQIANAQRLALLNLSGCVALRAVPVELARCTTLTELDLTGTRLVAAVPEAVRALPNLRRLAEGGRAEAEGSA